MMGNDSATMLLQSLAVLAVMPPLLLIEASIRLFSKKYRDDIARKKAHELVWKLKSRGLIELNKRGKRAEYMLSEKGKMKLLKHKISKCKLLPKGRFVVVIFDIPEGQRKLRNEFRWILKQNKFIKLQLSVWASRQAVYKDIKDLINELGIQKWVTIFYASDLTS